MGLNVLVYGINFIPELTGSGKYTGEMAVWLASRGHQVTAIVAPPHYPSWQIDRGYKGKGLHVEEYSGVKVYRIPLFLPGPDKLSAINRIRLETTFSLNALRVWGRVFTVRSSYDVVIAVSPPMQVGFYPWVYRKLRGVPWVFHIQDLQVDAAVRLGLLKGRLTRILYGVESFLLRHATRVSTITEAMRRRIVEKGVPERNTWLFPNWSDISFVRPLPHDNNFRREMGVGDHQVLVMYAGNMGEKQGLELVLHAADHLRNEEQIRFALVGAGVARSRLERLAEELRLPNVMFFPVQPLERLPEMLAAADIHLVVQRREAADLVMPSKLTNILAAGRPSVATADSGTALHQVLTEHNAGFVTPPGDVDAFVKAIIRLSRDADLRSEMGRNARTYAERYLDKGKILSDFEEKLIRLVEEERGGRSWSARGH